MKFRHLSLHQFGGKNYTENQHPDLPVPQIDILQAVNKKQAF